MQKPIIGLIALLATAGAHTAGEPPVQVFDVDSRVSVDAKGEVTQVQPPASLPKAIADAVVTNVERLRFLPPTVDGEPVQAVQTHVLLQACAATVGSNYELSMAYRAHGPSLVLAGAPATPDEVMRDGTPGAEAGFVLHIEWSADGNPRLAQFDALEGNSIYHQDYLLKQAVMRWLRGGRFQPEQVDGKPRLAHSTATVKFNASAPLAQVELVRGPLAVAGEAAAQKAQLPGDCPTALAQDRGADATRPLYLESTLKLRPND
jgi:hypothetical protein